MDVPRIVAGLRVGQSFSAIPVPDPPMIRKGASGTFYEKGLEGAGHHAVIPNVPQPTPDIHDSAMIARRNNLSWDAGDVYYSPLVPK